MPTPKPPNLVGRFPHIPEPYRSDALLPAYYLAFGRFINQFGQSETTLSYHLEEFAEGILGGGTGDDRAALMSDMLRALLGSKRSKDLVNSFNLCISAWNKSHRRYTPETLAEIKQLFDQFNQIRFLRDRTAHYGVQPYAEGKQIYFSAANRYTVNDIEKTEQVLFTIEHIEAATADLATLCMRLPFALGMRPDRDPNNPDPQNPAELPPWRYKPGELKKRAVRYPPNPRSPSRPPSAWWERKWGKTPP